MLRSLTGFGCSSCSTSARLNGAECNHPTAFTVPPLLAGDDQFHYDWCLDTSWIEIQSITLMPAHPHSVGEPHTHALLLPSFPSLFSHGFRDAASDFVRDHSRPFYTAEHAR